MPSSSFGRAYRGTPIPAAAASSSLAFGRAYRGGLGLPAIKLAASTVLVRAGDGWGLSGSEAASSLASGADSAGWAGASWAASVAFAAYFGADAFGWSDGRKDSPGSPGFGPLDDFSGSFGVDLASRPASPGPGSWSKASGFSGTIRVGMGRAARYGTEAAEALYLAPLASGGDARATWTQGDDDAVMITDASAGVGLRVGATGADGYFVVSRYDEFAGTGEWRILRRLAGAETVLASAPKVALLLTPAACEFAAVGASLTFKVGGATILSATDYTIPPGGAYAMRFKPLASPEGAGSWIADFAAGGSSAVGALRLGPERVDAAARAAEGAGSAEGVSIAVAAAPVVPKSGAEAWGLQERPGVLASLRAGESPGWADAASPTALAAAGEALAASDTAAALALVASVDGPGWSEGASIGSTTALAGADAFGVEGSGPPPAITVLVLALSGVDGFGLDSAGASSAAVGSAESLGWDDAASASSLFVGVDGAGLDAAAWSREVLASIAYTIYGNAGDGGPIDYSTPLATVTVLEWETAVLAAPGRHRFGVRVTSSVSGLQEKNVDAAVEIVLDGDGGDVTGRPAPVSDLRAYAIPGGAVRVEWAYPPASGPRRPTGFRIYAGDPAPDYGAPAAVVPFGARTLGSYAAELSGLADGGAYRVAVRAYNATAEDGSTASVAVVPDATPPGAVDDLTGAASSSG